MRLVFGMDKNVEIEIIKRQNEDLLENVSLYSLEEVGKNAINITVS